MSRSTTGGSAAGAEPPRSGRDEHRLEGELVEPGGPGERLALLVDHGDGVPSRERPGAAGRIRADLVEVDDAEAGEWVEVGGLVRSSAASDAGVDGDGRWEPGVDREVDRLRRGLVREEVVRRAGRLGVEAEGGADDIAGADGQVDRLDDALCREVAGDVLRGVDGHLDVDVEEAEAGEGAELVGVVDRAGAE